MEIQQFKKFSKFLAVAFKMLAIFVLGILIVGSFNVFIRQNFAAFSADRLGTISYLFSGTTITQNDYEWAISIVLPIILAFIAYIFFKVSYLFDYLAEGKTPFAREFTRSIKIISFLLIISDVITSLLYTVFVNYSAEEGGFIYFSLSSLFFIGLILYLLSIILNYGISLQEVADKTAIKNEENL